MRRERIDKAFLFRKSMVEFLARVHKIGENPCVDIPKQVIERFKAKGYIPVKGTINEYLIQTSLVQKGKGYYCLYLNEAIRKKADVKVGDLVKLNLEIDPEPKEIHPVSELVRALKENKKAKEAFDYLTKDKQREILVYLHYLKTPESRKRHVEKVIKFLIKKED